MAALPDSTPALKAGFAGRLASAPPAARTARRRGEPSPEAARGVVVPQEAPVAPSAPVAVPRVIRPGLVRNGYVMVDVAIDASANTAFHDLNSISGITDALHHLRDELQAIQPGVDMRVRLIHFHGTHKGTGYRELPLEQLSRAMMSVPNAEGPSKWSAVVKELRSEQRRHPSVATIFIGCGVADKKAYEHEKNTTEAEFQRDHYERHGEYGYRDPKPRGFDNASQLARDLSHYAERVPFYFISTDHQLNYTGHHGQHMQIFRDATGASRSAHKAGGMIPQPSAKPQDFERMANELVASCTQQQGYSQQPRNQRGATRGQGRS